MHIWPPTRENDYEFRSFSFDFCIIHDIWSFFFWIIHLFLKSILEIFDISTLWFSLWLFEHHTFQFKRSLSLFPFLQLIISFSFWDLHLVSSICKNIKIKVGRYIGISLCKYQDKKDYWPIIHDKLENLFTTITHRFQDFFHKDKCAYRKSYAHKCSTP